MCQQRNVENSLKHQANVRKQHVRNKHQTKKRSTAISESQHNATQVLAMTKVDGHGQQSWENAFQQIP